MLLFYCIVYYSLEILISLASLEEHESEIEDEKMI